MEQDTELLPFVAQFAVVIHPSDDDTAMMRTPKTTIEGTEDEEPK